MEVDEESPIVDPDASDCLEDKKFSIHARWASINAGSGSSTASIGGSAISRICTRTMTKLIDASDQTKKQQPTFIWCELIPSACLVQ